VSAATREAMTSTNETMSATRHDDRDERRCRDDDDGGGDVVDARSLVPARAIVRLDLRSW